MLVPAAQYVRMSTEHQQYSIRSQATTIQRYAERHGLEIVQTYSDPGRSGLMLKRRPGLRSLLQDIAAGNQRYQVVLVYDVSRWGRFQDTDEAAHYEFICKSAGIPVVYCAETFSNDGSIASLIMKSLKRIMAGEYSRELSVKVYEGQKGIVQLGYRSGGPAGYGLRRLMVSADGDRQQQLPRGARKGLATDRVILVRGPAEEVRWVRKMYRMAIAGKSAKSIAGTLNRSGVKYLEKPWTYDRVLEILRNPKYAGCNAWGRTSGKLGTTRVGVPQRGWILKPGAFEAIVDQQTFDQAQRVLHDRTFFKTKEEVLEGLRRLLREKGKLSEELVDKCRYVPTVATYQRWFGGLKRAYDLIGYQVNSPTINLELRRHTYELRTRLFKKIVREHHGKVRIVRDCAWGRARLKFSDELNVSVLISQPLTTPLGHPRWCVVPARAESRFVTLLCRCDSKRRGFHDFHVLPDIDKRDRFTLKNQDKWLERGRRLTELRDLHNIAKRVLRETELAASNLMRD